MDTKRGTKLAAIVAFSAAVGLFGGPVGCLPEIPEVPTAELPPAEIPAAPELTVPEFTPPEITLPEGPELPAQPPESAGNCCIRTGKMLRTKCGNALSCCTKEFEDRGSCEENKGEWFFTEDGCLGAC